MKEIEKAIIAEVRIKVPTFYEIQKWRIQAELRWKAFVRNGLFDEESAKALHFWIDEKLKALEEAIKTEMQLLIKDLPVWKEILSKTPGIGPVLGACWVAAIGGANRFYHPSSLWKYGGQDVDKHGEAPRRQRGKKIDYYPFVRLVYFKTGTSFVRQDAAKCQYRRLYDQKKAFYQKKYPEWQFCYKCGALLIAQPGMRDRCSKNGCKGDHGGIKHPTRKTQNGDPIYIHTKGHLDNMAKRYAAKIFSVHLLIKWRELEGLPVSDPWIISHGGHGDYIEPEHF